MKKHDQVARDTLAVHAGITKSEFLPVVPPIHTALAMLLKSGDHMVCGEAD